MNRFDVIVIGAGVMGSGTAWNLARDGVKVLLIEQFAIGHANGSSHGESRIIRRSYSDSAYVPLVDLSYRLWRELEAESGRPLLEITGGLDLGEADSPYLAACRATMEATGVAYEKLNAVDLRRRFPQFKVTESTIANYQSEAGVLRAGRCVETAVAMAEKRGAVVRANEPVLGIRISGQAVEVSTTGGTYVAEKLVVTAGSWTGLGAKPTSSLATVPTLSQMLGLTLPLTVLRQQKCYFSPADRGAFEPGRFPVWIWKQFGAVNEEMYGFPWIEGARGIKLAHHDVDRPREGSDPRAVDRVVEQAYIDQMRVFLRRRIPLASGPYQGGAVCMYTMTPDRDFILDTHPAQPRVVIGAGFSGTGFKFGPGVGRVLAELAQGRAPSVDLTRFRLARLGSAVEVRAGGPAEKSTPGGGGGLRG